MEESVQDMQKKDGEKRKAVKGASQKVESKRGEDQSIEDLSQGGLDVDPSESATGESEEHVDDSCTSGCKHGEQGPKERDGQEDVSVEYKNKYYYLAAEFENAKKRFQKERENFIKFGNEQILSDLLDVLDNFDRTVQALSEDDEKTKNLAIGIKMVHRHFIETLEKYALVVVETLGKQFDPNLHEAVGQKETEGKDEQEILEELQKGYQLNGRLLRPAKVIIAKLKD